MLLASLGLPICFLRSFALGAKLISLHYIVNFVMHRANGWASLMAIGHGVRQLAGGGVAILPAGYLYHNTKDQSTHQSGHGRSSVDGERSLSGAIIIAL